MPRTRCLPSLAFVLLGVLQPGQADGDLHSEAVALNTKAAAAFEAGNLDAAAMHFRDLDKLVGHVLPLGLTNLAVVYTQANEHHKALKVYKKLRKKFPNDAAVAFQYCRFGANLLNMKRPPVQMAGELLETVCKRSLEMNPTDPEAAVLLGSIYTLAMQYDHARPILERAVKMSKGVKEHRAMYQQALTNLALSNLRGGRPKDALKFSRRLYKTFGGAATETYAHTRTVALPYDVESILLSIKARNTFVKALRHTGVNCPSGEWHMAWNITKVPDSVPGTTITLLNPTEAYLSFGEDYAVQFAGELLLPYLNEYHEHFVYRLDFEGGGNDAFVWGQAGLVHGKCTLIGGAYWVMYPTQEIAAIPEGVYVKAVTINDPVISLLPMYNAANFYHFVCEGLLRLLYVWDDFIADPTMKLLVPGVMPGATSLPRHIEQSLPLLNISRDRLILFNSEPNRVYHFTNKFTVVDWMAPAVDEHGSLGEDPWSPVYQPRGGLHMLRDRFHQVLREHGKYTTAKPWHIVYVSRRRGVRMIANEGTVISQIRASFGYKRVLIHTGDESFIDQVAMFQKAALVIGAHGAGLSNLVFCSPGASVMIFPMRPHVDHTYGHMASALGLHHWVVTEVSSYYYGNYGEINDKNIELIIETATTILESGPSSRADL